MVSGLAPFVGSSLREMTPETDMSAVSIGSKQFSNRKGGKTGATKSANEVNSATSTDLVNAGTSMPRVCKEIQMRRGPEEAQKKETCGVHTRTDVTESRHVPTNTWRKRGIFSRKCNGKAHVHST